MVATSLGIRTGVGLVEEEAGASAKAGRRKDGGGSQGGGRGSVISVLGPQQYYTDLRDLSLFLIMVEMQFR